MTQKTAPTVTVGDILAFLSEFAPVSFAEEWDNVGLLCGDAAQPVTTALVALDITADVAKQAAQVGAQLVVSHHPVIFHPLHAVTAKGPGGVVLRLAAAGVSAICMHTNLDICTGGVNDALAAALGFTETRVLMPVGKETYQKVVAFVPKEYARQVRDAMTAAGAGRLGDYDSCSFVSQGEGSFRPLAGAKPFLGEQGRLETVEEARVEVICPEARTDAVVSAMRVAHPYEEPAYDVFEDAGPGETYGLGRLAALEQQTTLTAFAATVKERLGCKAVLACDAGRSVKTVAICSGACDGDVLGAAACAGADTLVTGEIKHSLMLEALERGVNILAAGHYETENVVCAPLCGYLRQRFPGVDFRLADTRPPAVVL